MRPIAKRALFGVTLVLLVGLVICGAWIWWSLTRHAETTDNAYLHAEITVISPKVAGYVGDVLVGDNQIVQAGEILIRIADEDYRAQRDRAAAAVTQAEAAIVNLARRRDLQHVTIREADAAVDLAHADIMLTERELDRATRLVGTGAVPRRNHDLAVAAAERARANVARAEAIAAAARERIAVLDSEAPQLAARLSEARASLELAELALAETVIRAPVAGVVGNRRVRQGEYVRAGSMLLSVVPVDGVWVVANFKETQLAHLRIGQQARIAVDGYSDVALDGVVDSLAPASGAAFSLLPPDNATGNFVRVVQRVPVKIRLLPDHALLGRLVPGMSAEVRVDLRSEGLAWRSTGDDLASMLPALFRTER